MSMVFGLDLHRQQITFDGLDVESGEVWKGRVWQPDRERFRRWLERDVAGRAKGQPVALAVEGCTGWRYVVEEITAAGFEAHLAEPADTQAARGPKRRAKTDRSDAALLRELLQRGDLPESWIPPTAVLEWRERVRLYKSLVDQRSVWTQRIHAELFQHGVSIPEGQIRSVTTRTELANHAGLSPAALQRIRAGYAMIDAADAEPNPQVGHDPIRQTAVNAAQISMPHQAPQPSEIGTKGLGRVHGNVRAAAAHKVIDVPVLSPDEARLLARSAVRRFDVERHDGRAGRRNGCTEPVRSR